MADMRRNVRQWPVGQAELSDPSIAAFAENCGGIGIRVDQTAQHDGAISSVLAVKDRLVVCIGVDVPGAKTMAKGDRRA
jgi:thiamine pyrophosphate-dependent acetolactate synthase large subunit-like protein